jgi:monothiol glutaredoxin
MQNERISSKITDLIKNNDIVLFMKGTTEIPMCGFSGVVVAILNKLNIEAYGVNILEDNELRQGIKDFSDWPTIPQLYIKGEFIGGCDIIKDMYEKGELQALLKSKNILC